VGRSTKAILLATALATLAVSPVFAMGDRPPHHPRDRDRPVTTAPEIDAGSGLASIAAVLAALCLAWERRRRSA
jgi:hypothetical protein